MEIQQLYYYMELCKQKNFTEAGYACNMTQGALSKQIRKLENELGITLIRRNTRKFELSKEGDPPSVPLGLRETIFLIQVKG